MTGLTSDRAGHPCLSIIVPVLNEIEQLPELLTHLQIWRGKGHEVLLVDGGSKDGTTELADEQGFKVIRTKPGRALQMNGGAQQAKGDILLFLHADSQLPECADEIILQAYIKRASKTGSQEEKLWGRFDVNISGDVFMLKMVAWFMNWRSRLSGIATGDQAMFVDCELFEAVGGFPEQPLMEDIELSKKLKKICAPLCIKEKLTTSGRRWLNKGIWTTIFLMWRLRWAYWRGVASEELAKDYQ